MKQINILLWCVLVAGCSSFLKRQPQSEMSRSAWFFEETFYRINESFVDSVYLRTGYYLESEGAQFKGCVLYLEGLADSVANHSALFNKLSLAGYRVVFFDYMGQGGSKGSMNNTRILSPVSPSLQISAQAKFVWQRYSDRRDEVFGRDCSQSKKMVMGWSTGGLATYGLANEEWAEAVVLIAPGIHPKKFVGEAATSPKLMFTLDQVISERTLTRNKFEKSHNPHIDPIKPVSPAVVPLFATNLLLSSEFSQGWEISKKIPGLVFLSGLEDTYVDRAATQKTLKKKAPHFQVVAYTGALHEIDNEIPEVANDMYEKTVQFFDSVFATRP
ncbi:serine aminopeptidase domain-containing protein [Bdellovibrio sp. HCB-110]|uniref:serine aminopeptidase domain-containing protein n=1 Tax=Bdellovibrio sp. HCB-110 TaxID=3391182 RepID=UPI0039B4F543